MTKIVLGGGLSGLSSAYYLSQRVSQHGITVVEKSDRLGGWVKSNKIQQDILFEEGPRTIRPHGDSGANTLELLQSLNLASKVRPILSNHSAAKNRMIYTDNSLHSLPSSLGALFKTQPPFAKPLIRYLLNDLRASKETLKDDSIYNFAKRRFGKDVAELLISPMICGICAGNAKEISVQFLMKRLFEYEQKHGSIAKGLLKNILNRNTPTAKSQLEKRARSEKWNIYSLEGGLETLPRALEREIKAKGVAIHLGAKCTKLEFHKQHAIVQLDNGTTQTASHVISALPAACLGVLIEQQHPPLTHMLSNIKNVTVAVVNLIYAGRLIQKPGFGFLVPPKEKLPILGVIFDSCCFPAGKNDTVLTVMMGGYWFESHFGQNPLPDILLKTAKEQLEKTLNIRVEPTQYKVNILRDCIPQYVVGHYENLENTYGYIKRHNLPLSLCGASYEGVGVNDVIMSARKVVDMI